VSIQFDVCGALEHEKSPPLYAVSKRALVGASYCSLCGGLSWEQEYRFNDKYMCKITEMNVPYPAPAGNVCPGKPGKVNIRQNSFKRVSLRGL
jgi:hypothetical protein